MKEPLTIPSVALLDAVSHFLSISKVHKSIPCDQAFCDHMDEAWDEIANRVLLEFSEMEGWKQIISDIWPARSEFLQRMPYPEYLKTEHWKKLREKKLLDSANRCQLCNSESALNVHHRTYERRGHEHDSDLIVLCASCHQRFHGIQPTP